MRTTIDLDDDVEVALAELMSATGMGKSKALNELARRGATRGKRRTRYVHRTVDLGQQFVDVVNIGEVVGLLDDEEHARTGP